MGLIYNYQKSKSMKKSLLFFLVTSFTCFSQTVKEIEFIRSKYNLDEINILKENIINSNTLRSNRVQNYLNSNFNKSLEFYSGGTKYMIYDVIDNNPVYISTDNRLSALASKTNTLYPGGSLGLNLTGSGMKVGVWEINWPLVNHQEFMTNSVSKVTVPDSSSPIPNAELHATHVVGTIAAKGVEANAKGMAYESNIVAYTASNDSFEVTDEGSNNGLLISNHSYGVRVLNDNGELNVPNWYMGCYNSTAREWDQVSQSLPYYLMVTSAGNSGLDSYPNGLLAGIDKLTGNKNCKNNLVVANANPTVHPITGVMSNLVINPSSSQGPSDDGRIKPDIAADGTNLFSASSASTTSYDTLTGTSMASPTVAGTLILLQQHYNNLNSNFMRAATVKGLVCHTALDDNTNIGPDPYFGWGFLDANSSASLISNSSLPNPTAIITERTISQSGVNSTYSFQVTVNDPKTLKATLCWTDIAGSSRDNQLNSSTRALSHDLDLKIIKNSETFFPWKLDLNNLAGPAIKGDNLVDNVEKVEVDNATGTYTIQVTKKGFLSGGSQAYSLIVSGFDQVSLSNSQFSQNKITVYPNPVNDVLYVNSELNNFTAYELFDIQGRLIKKETLSNLNSFEIETSSLIKGLYMLNLKSDKGVFTQKLVKR